jgi:hypothetical protein
LKDKDKGKGKGKKYLCILPRRRDLRKLAVFEMEKLEEKLIRLQIFLKSTMDAIRMLQYESGGVFTYSD